MSDSNQKEPGRFGDDGAAVIQVTPGQIVGAALFLLVAATIIFFAGVFARGLTMSKTDEEPAPPAPAPLELENVAVLPAPEPVEPEPEPEPTPPKPAEEKTPPPKATPEPEPEPEPAPEVVKTAPPVIEVKPVKADADKPEPVMETAPPAPDPEPEPEPEPEAPTPEEPSPPPPAEPKPQPLPELPPSTTGPFTVQVMSIGVAKRAQAEAYQRDALENKDVQVTLVESSDGKLIRAYVGSYDNRADADQARNALVRAGFDGCFVKQRED